MTGLPATVEAKAPRSLDPEKWGIDELPGEYQVQVLAQIAVAHALHGIEVGLLAAMARAPEWRQPRIWAVYEVRRDPKLEAGVVSMVNQWVETYVLAGRCPPADGSDDANNTLRRIWSPVDDRAKTATPDQLERYRRFLQTRSARDELVQRYEEIRQQLMIGMGDATVLLHPDGERMMTWRVGRDGVRRLRVMSNNAILEDDS